MRFRAKAVIAFLGAGLACIGATGIVLNHVAKGYLREEAFNRVKFLREAKAHALHTYLKDMRIELSVLTDCPGVAQAIVELGRGMEALPAEWKGSADPAALTAEIVAALTAEFEPTELDGELTPEQMVPINIPGAMVQVLYVARNPHPSDRRHFAVADDGSAYSRAHAQAYPLLTSYYEKFGFNDILLIEPDGRVVYTVRNRQELGGNLLTGPLKETSLAHAFRIAADAGPGGCWIEPFRFYAPGGMKPAAFLACAVYQGDQYVGVIAAEISIDQINAIVSGSGRWLEEGLGETGEVYVVGPDYTLRSESRTEQEDQKAYLRLLRSNGVDANTVEQIDRVGTGILLHQVNSEAARDALAGQSGTRILPCYHGVEAVISFAPFDVSQGIRWGIVAKIHSDEAFAGIARMRRDSMLLGAAAIAGLTALAWALSGFVVAPLRKLSGHARALGEGDLSARIDVAGGDEIGDLAGEFNNMASRLQSTTVSKDHVEAIIESMLDPLIVATVGDDDGHGQRITAVNRAATQVLGLDPRDLIGQPLNQVIEAMVAGDETTNDRLWMKSLLAQGSVGNVEVNWLNHDGEPIPMMFSATMLKGRGAETDSIVCVGHDLRHRKRAELLTIEHNKVQRELDIARTVQQGLLPKAAIEVAGYELAGWNRPADKTGGDYYDWIQLHDGRVALAIADVTGHGIGPALLMAICRAYTRASVPNANPLADAMSKLNELVVGDFDDGRFVTFAVAVVGANAEEIELLSAGHGPIFLRHAGDGAVESFGGDGLPLGVLPGETFEPRHLKFHRGDILFMPTDGFVEAQNAAGELFGAERLTELLERYHTLPIDELLPAIDAEVRAFMCDSPQMDDMTAVVLRRLK